MSETVKHSPGPWSVGYRATTVGCVNEKDGGFAHLFDVRGWGYLTGHGQGGLGLDQDTAYAIQKANAALAAAAPDMIEALMDMDAFWTEAHPEGPNGDPSCLHGFGRIADDTLDVWRKIRAAIAKATGATPSNDKETGTP